jgi:ubiquinone/menaquinone biosynthesis C-methylase UbiE
MTPNEAENLRARQAMFSPAKGGGESYFRALFTSLNIDDSCRRILEIGSGRSDLWVENRDRLPATVAVELIDVSPDMLDVSRRALGDRCSYHQLNLDFEELPRGTYDRILAFFVLQFLERPDSVLRAVRDRLTPDGEFHVIANTEEISEAFERDVLVNMEPAVRDEYLRLHTIRRRFSAENGAAQLERYFTVKQQFIATSPLPVTDPGKVIAMLRSISPVLGAADYGAVTRAIGARIESDGVWMDSHRSGRFVATLRP